MKLHYILLINQVSGNGNGKKTGAIIQNLLDEQKMSYESYYTEYAGHEAELAKELANSKLIGWNAEIKADYADKLCPLLVVIGGDGTLHQVLNQFYRMDKEIPVSYIPGGSGNDFARGINLPKDPQKAFWAIQRAKEPQIINTLTYEEKIQTAGPGLCQLRSQDGGSNQEDRGRIRCHGELYDPEDDHRSR